jgi:hypothetical protein
LLQWKTTITLIVAGKTVSLPDKKKILNGKSILSFDLPALSDTKITW